MSRSGPDLGSRRSATLLAGVLTTTGVLHFAVPPCGGAAVVIGRWPRSAGSRLQCIPEITGFLSGEFDDQATATLERDPHHDAAALLRDLERTITRPRLHGRHRYTSSWVGDCSRRPLSRKLEKHA